MKCLWFSRILILYPALSVSIFLGGCGEKSVIEKPQQGNWRAELSTPGGALPFFFSISYDGHQPIVHLLNGSDSIALKEVKFKNDTARIPMHIFDAEIIASIESDTSMSEFFYNYARGDDYRMSFNAVHGNHFRFPVDNRGAAKTSVEGKWEITFSPSDESHLSKGVGLFNQTGHKVTGTILSNTGDYRFLEGNVTDDSLLLSGFDGFYTLLYKAHLGDTLRGMFYSGNHFSEPWIAWRNDKFNLDNPDSLTWIKSKEEKLSFSFPNRKGQFISPQDNKYTGKVLIVQIMGSWCPNCMDETAFLSSYYNENRERGVEVIALAFERTIDTARAFANIERMVKQFDIGYDILLAGNSSKANAAEALPMLNNITAYPTTVFIDKSGNVRRIHTGFMGPATGEHFVEWKSDFVLFVDNLLAE